MNRIMKTGGLFILSQLLTRSVNAALLRQHRRSRRPGSSLPLTVGASTLVRSCCFSEARTLGVSDGSDSRPDCLTRPLRPSHETVVNEGHSDKL